MVRTQGAHYVLANLAMTGTLVPKSAQWIPHMRRALARGSPQAAKFLAINGIELHDGDDERAHRRSA